MDVPPVVATHSADLQAEPAVHRLLASLRQSLACRPASGDRQREGQTCHVERFNNILRQRLGRFVRRTLSFYKTDVMHETCLRLFLHKHNQRCLTALALTA